MGRFREFFYLCLCGVSLILIFPVVYVMNGVLRLWNWRLWDDREMP